MATKDLLKLFVLTIIISEASVVAETAGLIPSTNLRPHVDETIRYKNSALVAISLAEPVFSGHPLQDILSSKSAYGLMVKRYHAKILTFTPDSKIVGENRVGTPDGPFYLVDEHNNVYATGTFSNGHLNGEVNEYSLAGRLSEKYFFNQGILRQKLSFNEAGTLTRMTSYGPRQFEQVERVEVPPADFVSGNIVDYEAVRRVYRTPALDKKGKLGFVSTSHQGVTRTDSSFSKVFDDGSKLTDEKNTELKPAAQIREIPISYDLESLLRPPFGTDGQNFKTRDPYKVQTPKPYDAKAAVKVILDDIQNSPSQLIRIQTTDVGGSVQTYDLKNGQKISDSGETVDLLKK